MEEIFYDIYRELPRQGPGDKQSTTRALNNIGELPSNPRILDLGCGTGAQTFILAETIGGEIFAVDNYMEYLNELQENAEKFGYSDIIHVMEKNMSDLNFPKNHFDVIWAEGSIYIMGFENGLNYIKSFLKPGGYVGVTEISWLKENQPEHLLDFWNQEYAEMHTIRENKSIIRECGYSLIDSFVLSSTAWWDNYYIPLENRLKKMRAKYAENDDALELVEFAQMEIDLYRKYPEFYGYVFYVMQLI